jgi:Protein of unknown function (DUF732)
VRGCRSRRIRWPHLAAGALLSLGLLGCGGGPSAATSHQDQQFVDSVLSAAPDIGHYRNDTQLIRLGRAACEGFASGVSYEQLADRLALSEGSNPLPSEDLGTVITSAVQSFCPKYEDLVN